MPTGKTLEQILKEHFFPREGMYVSNERKGRSHWQPFIDVLVEDYGIPRDKIIAEDHLGEKIVFAKDGSGKREYSSCLNIDADTINAALAIQQQKPVQPIPDLASIVAQDPTVKRLAALSTSIPKVMSDIKSASFTGLSNGGPKRLAAALDTFTPPSNWRVDQSNEQLDPYCNLVLAANGFAEVEQALQKLRNVGMFAHPGLAFDGNNIGIWEVGGTSKFLELKMEGDKPALVLNYKNTTGNKALLDTLTRASLLADNENLPAPEKNEAAVALSTWVQAAYAQQSPAGCLELLNKIVLPEKPRSLQWQSLESSTEFALSLPTAALDATLALLERHNILSRSQTEQSGDTLRYYNSAVRRKEHHMLDVYKKGDSAILTLTPSFHRHTDFAVFEGLAEEFIQSTTRRKG